MEPYTQEEKEKMLAIFKKSIESNDVDVFFEVMRGLVAGYIAHAY